MNAKLGRQQRADANARVAARQPGVGHGLQRRSVQRPARGRAILSKIDNPPGDGSDIGAFEAGGFVRLTSLTRTNRTAHLQFTKDATTAPVPVYHVQRRAAFGTGDWAELPGPIGDTNALVPFLEPSATNGQNFYRVRVGP